ncbi:Sodium-coupled monocarboxylate transporter 1 [Xenoophorus captivus]|uniref:Sodium-coupled monocarboxylate transporter 1 n=1 Tax=Xenoophorus captivus TaxID=1517983 RepID=A0ABV0QG90_9TELE
MWRKELRPNPEDSTFPPPGNLYLTKRSTMVGTGGPVSTFSVWDYVVFAVTILGAASIGLFQAIRGRKETSSAEFLLGGRQMTAVPVAMSLTASFMSGITVIGTPAEAYRFGTAFWLFGFSYAIMSIITAELFVPLFYRLAITSAYEVGTC